MRWKRVPKGLSVMVMEKIRDKCHPSEWREMGERTREEIGQKGSQVDDMRCTNKAESNM